MTYTKQIVKITSTRLFIRSYLVLVLDNIIRFPGLLGVLDFGKGLVAPLPKLGNKDWLLLLGDDQLIVNNLQDKSCLILKFSILSVDLGQPIYLSELAIIPHTRNNNQPFALCTC